MKKWFNIFLLSGVSALLITSCKKDEDRSVLIPQNAPKLTASATTMVLDSNKRSTNVVTFNWNKVSYGYAAVVTYSLEFSLGADNFSSSALVEIGSDVTSASFTHGGLDTVLYQTVGLEANVASAVKVRVRADVKKGGSASGPSSVAPVYSDTVNMTITPYQFVLVYPVVYVPGAYQGWTPATASQLASVKSDNAYEGYVNYTAGNLAFKITPAPNWDASYGSGGGDNLSKTGGDLTVPAAGYYRLEANISTLKWSATKTDWGIIGSATPGGTATDTKMTYNSTTQTWSVTANLTAGGLKFRANSDAAVKNNLGLTKGKLAAGGTDITVAAAGNYTITLDLSKGAGNYAYALKKN